MQVMANGPDNHDANRQMSVFDDKTDDKGQRFPYHPVALKIAGDAILAASLLRASTLEPGQGTAAVILALVLGVATSAIAGMQLVRLGQRQLWEVTSVACLGAMGVMLTLHGELFFGILLGAFAYWRWRRLEQE